MKFIYSLLIVFCVSLPGFAQVIAIAPAGDGGFETGPSLTTNGWTQVNPGPVTDNHWTVGTGAAPLFGTKCAYITNSAIAAYAYTTTQARTAHFYRDVTIPAGSTNLILSFLWKGFGEAGVDQMFISLADNTVTPAVNVPVSPSTSIPGATLIWTQPTAAAGTFTPETISIPTTWAGTTVRFIFSWETNASGGTTPGGALDSISFTYDCPEPAPITGTFEICTGTTTTLADASVAGAWSSSDPAVAPISSAGLVSGLTQGTTIISYTTVCLSPATAIISVNNAPAAITGDSIVCIGSTMPLGETSTGGTWTSSDPLTAPVSATGVVSGLALGTAIITYANSCGLPVTRQITVSTIPPTITGPLEVCEGGATIALSHVLTGGTWSSAVPGIATATTGSGGTGTITGITAGTVSISYTPTTTCPTSVVVTVKPLPAPTSGIVPICVGNTMLLSNSAGGGLWSSSVPGVATIDGFTGLVTGIVGGTTTISYTNGCGTGTSVITVDALPAPITGYDSVCIGSHTTLADPTIGGTWISSNPAVASVVSSGTSGVLTGIDVGYTIVTYMMPGGCYVTTEVTSFLLPSAISGLAAICPGATTTLSNSITGGTWTSANPAVATITPSGGLVIGISSDTVGMLYTTPYGCTAYGVVTVNPVPDTILGMRTLCPTFDDTLANITPGGVWSSLNGGVATIDAATGIVHAVSGGTATIVYTLGTGCLTQKTLSVNPLPVPVVSFNTAINTFFTTAGFTSYQWYNSLGMIAGATSDHTAGLVNGFYYVVVTDANNCVGSSAHVPYNVSMEVAHQAAISDIKVYPNPASDEINIQSSFAVNVVISSIDGRKVIEQNNAGRIDISKLVQGLYIVSISDENGNLLRVDKLTKE